MDLQFTPQLTGEVVYFPYVPLNGAAHFQHVLERAKIEYAPSATWKFGAGYGAYQYSGQTLGANRRATADRAPETRDR